MPYIGTSPSNGVRRVYTYTATASQTTFSGVSNEGSTLAYVDNNYLDVYQNGILLGSADYTSTTGTSVVLAQAASVNDIIVIVAYDVFSVADTVSKTDGGTFDGNIAMGGTLSVTGNTTLSGDLSVTGSITGHGKRLISTTTASSSANVTLSFSGYEAYLLQIVGLVPATDNVAGKLEWSADDGSSYLSSGIYSSNLAFRLDSTGANSVANPSNNASFLTVGSNYDSTASVGSTVEIYMPNLSNNILTGHRRNGWYFESGYKYNNIIRFTYGGFHLTNTDALNKLRFTFSSGNISTGVFKLFGMGAV